ncbi:hypothetical protein E2C01_065561 [Portunus trituberculatus]|uniref:Uncharacterized protein n=1 Tax=Portunus trituberculatus TaxID=210409 RepID=A0A5B7HNJ4_PORTR|nr:hypothetical protein [Portunus trituberculatus]
MGDVVRCPIDKDTGWWRLLSVLQVLPCQSEILTTALGIVSRWPRAQVRRGVAGTRDA